MTDHTDLIARLRKDDLFWEAPITCRSEAADALEAAQAEIANLHTVMMAAAVEISEHWDAHCDAEGYGPVNLLRRLENGYPDKYGYDSHTVVRMEKERDAALARLAELTKQEPVAAQIRVAIASESGWSDWREINLSDADREYRNGVETRKLYAAAGASPVQPIQGLQSVADALTIEQLNDKVERLMAVQPSQAVEVSKQDIYDIAHRKATRYVCTAAPYDVMYGFSEMHLLDFVAAINAKESGK